MATQGLVGMRHHNRLSPTSPLQELQTTTTTYEERASLEADLALADELTMACVREFFL